MRPEDNLPVVLKQVANNVATLPDHQQRATIQHLHDLPQQLPCPIKEPEVVRTRDSQPPQRKEILLDLNTWNNSRSGEKRSALAGASATAKHRRTVQLKARLPRLQPHFELQPTDRHKEPPCSAFRPHSSPWLQILLLLLLDIHFRVDIQILAPTADESLLFAPLGYYPQPGAIGGGGLGDVGHNGDGGRTGDR